MKVMSYSKIGKPGISAILSLMFILVSVPCVAGGPSVGEAAPDFSSLSTSGRYFEFSKVDGKPVLLSFWSDWCSSERQELQFLKKVTDSYPEVVIAIVASESGTPSIRSLTRISMSLAEWGVGAKILIDRDHKITGLYNVTSLPTSVLIDPVGKIAYSSPSFFNSDMDEISESLNMASSFSLLKTGTDHP